MSRRARKDGTVLQLRIKLNDVEPEIWRRLLVRSDISLGQLHFVLNAAMGWTCSHLHSFALRDRTFGDPELDEDDELEFENEHDFSLQSLVTEGQVLRYDYDFGDGWEHEVRVEARLRMDERVSYPLCIAGARACPPEDCGGLPGYNDLLRSLANPKDPDHDEVVTWVGGFFDPEGFDVNRTNDAIRALKLRTSASRRGSGLASGRIV
jgi:Plasmid pRiA4b ORF-3-like protein